MTEKLYLCSISLHIHVALCISLASVEASSEGEHFVLTCFSRGMIADAAGLLVCLVNSSNTLRCFSTECAAGSNSETFSFETWLMNWPR